MKSFAEYLTESKKTYQFRMKIAGELDESQLDHMERCFEKYGLISISKPKTTPIQENPMGFSPAVTNTEVNIIDVEVEYPTTPQELTNMLQHVVSKPESHIVIMNKNHPDVDEENQQKDDKKYKTIIGNDYEKQKQEVVYGDKYNKKMLKDIETKKYPAAAGGKTTKANTSNDLPQNTKSPLGS